MKSGIIRSLFFSVNIDSGINFFIKPPSGGRPPRESRARENNKALVGFLLTFLKEESLYRSLVLHMQKIRTLFNR